jgi:hypothetical protein
MVPMGSPGSGKRGGSVSPCAVTLDDIEDEQMKVGPLACVGREVRARLWNLDVKAASSISRLE